MNARASTMPEKTDLPETGAADLTPWERPIRIGEVSSEEAGFTPFDRQILCPECYHEFLLQISPVHLKVDIECPKCMSPLGDLIRQHIAQRILKQERKVQG